MELESSSSSPNFAIQHSNIDRLQRIFFNRNTNLTTYKYVYKQLLKEIPVDNTTVELLEIINNFYNNRIDEESFNQEVKYLLSVWVLICVIGVVSNIYVITVLSKVRQKIVYEIFCIGLAVTDLSILVFAVPITTLHYGIRIWIFGDVICKMVNFLVYMAVFSSTMMLLILTITRFMAVVFPWENRSFSTQKAKLACYIIWLLGAAFSTPVLIYYGVVDESHSTDNNNNNNSSNYPDSGNPNPLKCQANFTNELLKTIYFVLVFVLTYILPFKCVIIMNTMIVRRLKREFGQKKQMNKTNQENKVSSSFINKTKASLRENEKRQRRSRVTKIVILVTMLYCICWLPTQIVNFWYYIDPKGFPTTRRMQYIKFISQTLSFASACINPIVYSIMSDTFKKTQERICPCCFQNNKAQITQFNEFEDKNDINLNLAVVYQNKRYSETVIVNL